MDVDESQSETPGHEGFDRLFALAYDELRLIAHRRMAQLSRNANRGHTLGTTALVNEAYLKLVEQAPGAINDRNHFLAVASLAMRHILIDRAKAQLAEKRGGGHGAIVTFDDDAYAARDSPETLLDINEAIDRLALIDARLARVVVYRFFGGLSENEVADVLGVTVRTVQRDWSKARMLLRFELAAE